MDTKKSIIKKRATFLEAMKIVTSAATNELLEFLLEDSTEFEISKENFFLRLWNP